LGNIKKGLFTEVKRNESRQSRVVSEEERKEGMRFKQRRGEERREAVEDILFLSCEELEVARMCVSVS